MRCRTTATAGMPSFASLTTLSGWPHVSRTCWRNWPMNSAPTSSATASGTVLVVDDEVIARMVICEYLRHCGYRVIEAVNTDEALTILQHLEVQVDVILCSISEAGAAGSFRLAQHIRRQRPGID